MGLFSKKPEDPFEVAGARLKKAAAELEAALNELATYDVVFTSLAINANGVKIEYTPLITSVTCKFKKPLNVSTKVEDKKDDQKKSEAK